MFVVNNSLMVITSLVAADHPVAVVDRLFQWEGIINIAMMVNAKALLCPAFLYFFHRHKFTNDNSSCCEPTKTLLVIIIHQLEVVMIITAESLL